MLIDCIFDCVGSWLHFGFSFLSFNIYHVLNCLNKIRGPLFNVGFGSCSKFSHDEPFVVKFGQCKDYFVSIRTKIEFDTSVSIGICYRFMSRSVQLFLRLNFPTDERMSELICL
jgi:hypothetical protein